MNTEKSSINDITKEVAKLIRRIRERELDLSFDVRPNSVVQNPTTKERNSYKKGHYNG